MNNTTVLTFDQRVEAALSWLDTHKLQITLANEQGVNAADNVTAAALKLTGCPNETKLTALESAIRDFEAILRLLGGSTND